MTEPATLESAHLAEWEEQLQDLVDQVLPAAATIRLHAHLGSCLICTRAHRRLLSLDAQLRNGIEDASPSPGFNQRLFANIKATENRKRAITLERELADHLVRTEQVRNTWRAQLRFHLGNVVAGIATLAAITSTIASSPSTESKAAWGWIGSTFSDRIGTASFSWVTHSWLGALTGVAAIVLVGAAAVVLFADRGIDHRIR
jgi:hypothetical protein